MNFDEIKKTLDRNSDSKIVLFLRHAEKIQSSDSYLTQKGINDALTLANKLKSLNTKIRIISSPEPRCVQTAKIINLQFESKHEKLLFSNALGKPGLQILDNGLYEKLYEKLKCREIFYKWKNGQHYNALRDPESLKYLAKDYFQTTCADTGITLYISQSGTVASIGYALDLLDYDALQGEWVDFLEGFTISNLETD